MMNRPSLSACNRGFTLIELLVCITIIAVLLVLVLPAFSKARQQAWQVRCASNLRQVGIGNAGYMADHREWLLAYPNPEQQMIPKASRSYSANRPDLPNVESRPDWFTYWPDDIRWCPELLQDRDVKVGSIAWGPTWSRSAAYASKQLRFGYQMPILSEELVNAFTQGHSVNAYKGDGHREYIRPEKNDLARYVNSSGAISAGDPQQYYGLTWNYNGTVPYAMDHVFHKYQNNRYIVSHNEVGDSKNEAQFHEPRGANVLWSDGSVKWYRWTGSFRSDYREIATGRNSAPREGWTINHPAATNATWYIIARRGR